MQVGVRAAKLPRQVMKGDGFRAFGLRVVILGVMVLVDWYEVQPAIFGVILCLEIDPFRLTGHRLSVILPTVFVTEKHKYVTPVQQPSPKPYSCSPYYY